LDLLDLGLEHLRLGKNFCAMVDNHRAWC